VTRVTIVGAGNMGRGIGTRVAAGGHQVEIVDRDPADAQQLAEDLGGSATALDPEEPFGGEVVVFAVYYPGIKDAVSSTPISSPARSSSTSPTRSTPRPGTGWRRHLEPRLPRRSSSSSRRGPQS
jgi:3-hydroxyisobutyrate dehydrogenase-like beta-hydroxyacid dehydrogenase